MLLRFMKNLSMSVKLLIVLLTAAMLLWITGYEAMRLIQSFGSYEAMCLIVGWFCHSFSVQQ
jgi:maltodextrin utilization protein YvdJ